MSHAFDIAVLPGDGIGREVMPACLALLAAAEAASGGPTLRCTTHAAGALHYRDSGEALPRATVDACRTADAILFGAMGWPDIRYPDGTEPIPQLDLRMEFGLYAGVRPIRWFPGLPRVLADDRAREIDFVLVREQTEGLFYARGRGKVIDDREAYDTMQITRAGTARVSEFAFRVAERRRERRGTASVTCVDKSNVFASMAFFRKVFDEVATSHPAIGSGYAYVDAMALTMVKKPWTLDVLVTENMFGDILSDLGAGLIGGMGMAPSADIGDAHALFQPAHGTAPDIAGQGKANPSAMFLSAAMMLDWLAVRHREPGLEIRARLIERALEAALRSGAVPMEIGGTANCAEVTRATIAALPDALREDGVSYVVTVAFAAEPEFRGEFRKEMIANAQASRAREPGCRRFDVCESADGSRIFLYEVYDDEAAFKAHLATDHYLRFSERTTGWVAEKHVVPYNLLDPRN